MAPKPTPIAIQSRPPGAALPGAIGAKNATSASSGTIIMSSSKSTETMRCPAGDASCRLSSSNCMTIAVEVSTKPAPDTNDAAIGNPVPTPTPVSNKAETTT
jgi:hypothetical protein